MDRLIGERIGIVGLVGEGWFCGWECDFVVRGGFGIFRFEFLDSSFRFSWLWFCVWSRCLLRIRCFGCGSVLSWVYSVLSYIRRYRFFLSWVWICVVWWGCYLGRILMIGLLCMWWIFLIVLILFMVLWLSVVVRLVVWLWLVGFVMSIVGKMSVSIGDWLSFLCCVIWYCLWIGLKVLLMMKRFFLCVLEFFFLRIFSRFVLRFWFVFFEFLFMFIFIILIVFLVWG